MTILETLKSQLIGKKIILEKYSDEKNQLPPGYFADKSVIPLTLSPKLTYQGKIETTIIEIYVESDRYVGDCIYLVVDDEGEKPEIPISILDELNFIE